MKASGGTPLAKALREVTERAVNEYEQGDARPLVFIMTDGQPDDDPKDKPGDLNAAISTFLNHRWIGIGACAAGAGADVHFLQQFVIKNGEDAKELREVVVLDTADQAGFEKFFQVVTSTTIKGSSGAIKNGYDENSSVLT